MTDILEKCARAARSALHNKLFAMNGYTKLPGALDKQDEVVDEVVRAVIAALADGVTEEMGLALECALSEGDGGRDLSGNYKLRALSAAIRAAIPEGK